MERTAPGWSHFSGLDSTNRGSSRKDTEERGRREGGSETGHLRTSLGHRGERLESRVRTKTSSQSRTQLSDATHFDPEAVVSKVT